MNPTALLATTLALALATTALTATAASDWPQWRGPDSDATSSDATPPTSWSATENIQWKTRVPGKGSSSPVVLGDHIFLTTAIDTGRSGSDDSSAAAPTGDAPPAPRPRDPRRQGRGDFPPGRPGGNPGGPGDPQSTHQFVVLCFDRHSGEVRWQKAVNELVPHSGHHDDHGFASASPITDGKHVYAHFGSRGTFCLTVDGELVWSRTDLGEMTTRGGFGDGSSPTLHGDFLVIPWDHEGPSYITALNKNTGETVWKTDRDHPSSWATPLVVSEGVPRPQVIQNGEGDAVAYDLATGEEVWRASGQTARPCATPVAADGIAYIGSGFRGSFLGAYQLDGAKGDITGTGHELWTVTTGTPDIASLLVSGGRLYFLSGKSGVLTCVDAKTGQPHYERERLDAISRVYASPVAANGHVYLTGRSGTTVVIKDAPQLEIVSTNDLGEPVDTTPALAGDQLFVRTDKHLVAIRNAP